MSANPFLLAPAERLSNWRTFRRMISNLETNEQLREVAEFWGKAPIGAIAYDPDDASTWPTAWEMMHHNQWCRSSVAIGMESTLRLAGYTHDRLMLRLIVDPHHGILLVLVVDDTYTLNYNWGSVHQSALKEHRVIRQWRFAERDYCEF